MAQHVPRQSKDNLVQIRRWLDTCRSKHDRCNNWCSRLGTKGRRPTRVLELSDNAVRLRCNLQAIDSFEYLALSHMWGTNPSQQLRLTASTLQEFEKIIPLELLPSIFAEAIQITRHLGFRYLWIDSLCIIQDSKHDWTAEANLMSAVYNNAVCTIAVLFPPQVAFSSTQFRDDPRHLTPC
ncbi:HET-domain-containing protein, partial [Alternaria alternata]